MPLPAEARKRVRFGDFELNLQTRELRKNGRTFSLQEQPFQVLALLLARPGELVTREELKERLWSADTFVDFDQGLNKAVNRLREALGDSAADAHWIETLAGRGYRFTASVMVEPTGPPEASSTKNTAATIQEPSAASGVATPESSSASPATSVKVAKTGKKSAVHTWFVSRTRRMVALGLLFVAACLGFLQVRRSPHEAPGDPPRQLTSNSSENHISGGVISPDGKYLAYTDKTGMHIKLIATGDVQDVAEPKAVLSAQTWEMVRWFPDSTRFVVNSHPPEQDPTEWSADGSSIWIFSLLQGSPRKLRDHAEALSLSPDGAWIAFGMKPAAVVPARPNLKMGGTRAYPGRYGDREIWLMASDGQQVHELYATEEDSTFHGLNWSADGNRTLYLKATNTGVIIETSDLLGGLPKEVLRVPDRVRLRDYLWLPDGRLIYVLDGPTANSDDCNYWELPVNSRTGEPLESPRQLTNEAGSCMGSTSVTADGKHLAYLKWKANTSVYVADFQNDGIHITVPRRLTLDENYNNPMSFTPDSKSVFFLSNRKGGPWGIFKQALDGDTVETMTVGNGLTGGARTTPDGLWMLYRAHNWENRQGAERYDTSKVMRIPVSGGVPELVTIGAAAGVGCANVPGSLCAFAESGEDRKQLIFTALDPLKGRGRELARFATSPKENYSWNLSPDGTRIAVLQRKDSGITIIPLSGGHPYRVTVKGWEQSVSGVVWWTADGKGLIAGSAVKRGTALLHIDLKGNTNVLWQRDGSPGTFGVTSPDGHHLAMMAWDVSSNLWMMDNF